MKKIILSLCAAAFLFTACEKDEVVEVKDYGMKTIEADLMYDKDAAHGDVSYKQQTFIKLGQQDAVHIGSYGENSWTTFSMIKDPTHANHNITSDVIGWDIALTYYTEETVEYQPGKFYMVSSTGALINTTENIEVGVFEYIDGQNNDEVSAAFADLSLTDVAALDYSKGVDAIGRGWKEYDMQNDTYNVFANLFYVVKLTNGDIYKLRFVSFFGANKDERIIKFEYQLMQ